MWINKLELKELNRSALYVSNRALEVALKGSYSDMQKKGKAYVVYKICSEIYNTSPLDTRKIDCYTIMKYHSLRQILSSMCNDKEKYHVSVLNDCNDSDETWVAFDKMKYILDNFETELFEEWE
jgi:hypothetical protein|nr:MAG TPA: hypothetical protein [Caudoviricetes sp.]